MGRCAVSGSRWASVSEPSKSVEPTTLPAPVGTVTVTVARLRTATIRPITLAYALPCRSTVTSASLHPGDGCHCTGTVSAVPVAVTSCGATEHTEGSARPSRNADCAAHT